MMANKTSVQNPQWQDASDAPRISSVKRVGWVRVGALGDLLVAMACLEETVRGDSGTKVTVFGPRLWLELIDPILWPAVDKIVVIVEGDFGQEYTVLGQVWTSTGKGPQKLTQFFGECQVSVNLRVESYRYAWAPLFARVPVRFGTCPPHMQWLYTRWSPWLGKDPMLHERDRMLEILEAPSECRLSCFSTSHNRRLLRKKQTGDDSQKPNKFQVFPVGQSRDSLAYRWKHRGLPQIVMANPVTVRSYGLVPGNYWLINPTASRWEKAWPKEKFQILCERLKVLSEQAGKQLIVLGSPAETEWLQQVANSGKTQISIVQPKSLKDLFHVVALAEALVANTSSVQFIAAAVKTKCFTLMGRTYPVRWGPLGPQDAFLCGQQQDPPPADIFLDDYTAYDSLSVDHVYEVLRPWLFKGL